jgi:hypothetical protein
MRRRAMELRGGRIHNLQELKRCITGDLLSNVATGWGGTRGDATGNPHVVRYKMTKMAVNTESRPCNKAWANKNGFSGSMVCIIYDLWYL